MEGENPLITLVYGETYFDQSPLREVKDKQTHYRPGDALRGSRWLPDCKAVGT